LYIPAPSLPVPYTVEISPHGGIHYTISGDPVVPIWICFDLFCEALEPTAMTAVQQV